MKKCPRKVSGASDAACSLRKLMEIEKNNDFENPRLYGIAGEHIIRFPVLRMVLRRMAEEAKEVKSLDVPSSTRMSMMYMQGYSEFGITQGGKPSKVGM